MIIIRKWKLDPEMWTQLLCRSLRKPRDTGDHGICLDRGFPTLAFVDTLAAAKGAMKELPVHAWCGGIGLEKRIILQLDALEAIAFRPTEGFLQQIVQ